MRFPLKSRSSLTLSKLLSTNVSHGNTNEARKFGTSSPLLLILWPLPIQSGFCAYICNHVSCSRDTALENIILINRLRLSLPNDKHSDQLFEYLSNTVDSIISGHLSSETIVLWHFNVHNQYWLNYSYVSHEGRAAKTIVGSRNI